MSKKHKHVYNNNMNKNIDAVTQIFNDKAVEIEFVPSTKPKLTHPQIHDALMFMQDTMERAAFYDFVLLGDIAKDIVSTDLPIFNVDKIECGLKKKQYTVSGKSMLYTVLLGSKIYPREYQDRVEFEYKGVPIVLHLLEDSNKFLERPDSRFYTITEFRIPNPFKEYIKTIL